MDRGIVVSLLLAVVLSGCGAADSGAKPGKPAASPTAALPADGPVRTVATVIDAGDGAVLCLGDMDFSGSSGCDGPAVAGWDWADHPDAVTTNGTTSGRYELVGTWDGTTFTPTEVGPAPEVGSGPIGDVDFTTPCDEPGGGWVVVDPATTNNSAKGEASRVAEGLPDYGMTWVDQSINPAWDDWLASDGQPSLEVQQALNDPAYTILNVGVTDDVARAEATVREVWGGPLCVYTLDNTFALLREVAGDLQDLPGSLGAQFGTISNRVELSVVHDDGSIQAWVDEEYGDGVVEVTSMLVSVG